jgi:hypothetical protein
MVKALKVTMIVYSIIGILLGLAFIFIPDQMREWFDFEPAAPDYFYYFITLLAVQFIVASVFVIMAARDPIGHILWVKYLIAHAIVDALVAAYAMIRDYGDFSQIGAALIIHAVFAVLLLVFYPWRPEQIE